MHIFAITEAKRQSLAEDLAHLAAEYRDKLNVATIDAEKYSFFAEPLGLTPGRFPALVIEDVVSGETTPFDQERDITIQSAETFVEDYFWKRGIGTPKPATPTPTVSFHHVHLQEGSNKSIIGN